MELSFGNITSRTVTVDNIPSDVCPAKGQISLVIYAVFSGHYLDCQ